MTEYAEAIDRYLRETDDNQFDLAQRAGITQASISRYKGSDKTPPRLPSRDIAKRIDEATAGKVPFNLWAIEAAKQIGLAA
jgi:predicted transcriptional regulator